MDVSNTRGTTSAAPSPIQPTVPTAATPGSGNLATATGARRNSLAVESSLQDLIPIAAALPMLVSDDEEAEPTLNVSDDETGLSQDDAAQSTVTQPEQLPYLAPELLTHIGTMLDPVARQEFAAPCRMSRVIYQEHLFKKSCLELIEKDQFDDAEVKVLYQHYYFTLLRLFSEETDNDNFEKMVALAQKFFKHISKDGLRSSLQKALSKSCSNVQHIFEKLAASNLPLAISLLAALSDEELVGYGISNLGFFLHQLFPDYEHAETFFANFQQTDVNSALHFAVTAGYYDIALILLRKHPHTIDTVNQDGTTLLMEICSLGGPGEEIDDTEEINCMAALDNIQQADESEEQEEASTATDLEQLTQLLLEKADINLRDKAGLTVLMHAIILNQPHMVDAILKLERLSIDACDHAKKTALMLAAQDLRGVMVKALLNRNAAVNLTDIKNRTALVAGVTSDFDPDSDKGLAIIRLLLARGAHINMQDKNGFTALMHAVKHRHLKVVKVLLQNGALTTIINNREQTVMDIAQANEDLEIVQLLKNHQSLP